MGERTAKKFRCDWCRTECENPALRRWFEIVTVDKGWICLECGHKLLTMIYDLKRVFNLNIDYGFACKQYSEKPETGEIAILEAHLKSPGEPDRERQFGDRSPHKTMGEHPYYCQKTKLWQSGEWKKPDQ